jgi:diguanylate cyclase (GGDEF)-like protein
MLLPLEVNQSTSEIHIEDHLTPEELAMFDHIAESLQNSPQALEYLGSLAMQAAGLKNENNRLNHEATHDSLTGVYNRRGFFDAATEIIDRMGPNEAIITSLIDIIEFKPMNDTYGHAKGDAVLKSTAQGLQASGDVIVGRFGGDEFVVIEKANTSADDDATQGSAENAAISIKAHVEAAISDNIELSDVPTVTFSIGQSIRSDIARTELDDMIATADTNMYHDKHNVRHR